MTFDINIDNIIIPITFEDIDRYDFSHITCLNLTIGKSLTKNDQEGHGTQYYYDVKSNNNIDSPLIPQYCFVRSTICGRKFGPLKIRDGDFIAEIRKFENSQIKFWFQESLSRYSLIINIT
jgi:hypothetical protein